MSTKHSETQSSTIDNTSLTEHDVQSETAQQQPAEKENHDKESEIKTVETDSMATTVVATPEDETEQTGNNNDDGSSSSSSTSAGITDTSKDDVRALNADEQALFARMEEQLNQSLVNVAEALQVIKEQELYRAHFASFEHYCEAKMGRSRRYIQYMITWAVIRKQLLEHNVPKELLPTSEAQVRPLNKFKDAATRTTIWLRACEIANNSVPSREQVCEAVKETQVTSGLTSSSSSTTHSELHVDDCVMLTTADKKDDKERSAFVGYWGYVTKVNKSGTLQVAFPQKTLTGLPRDTLRKINEQSESDRYDADRKEVFKIIEKIYSVEIERESVIEANLVLLGKRKTANYTHLEQELLKYFLEFLEALAEQF